MLRTHTCLLWTALVLSTFTSAGAVGKKDSMLQTAVAHVPAVKKAAEAIATGKSAGTAHVAAPVHVKAAKQAGLAALSGLQKTAAPSELHATQPTISKRFHSVHNKQLAKIRLGEKALIGTYPSPTAKNIHDATEYLPFILPPAGLLLLGIVTFGVITIRKQQKIPHMPTQGRLDIKDVQASARQMQSKV
jgi:hypothetical protein